MLTINRIDHLVLTVNSIAATCDWYQRVLNMEIEVFADNRTALVFATNKINLHEVGNEFVPRAPNAMSGTGDFCLITETPLTEVIEHLHSENITIEVGPEPKIGANGPLLSVYVRDPDNNLVEISNYAQPV